jgi:long-chain acyl-CoA synthetase
VTSLVNIDLENVALRGGKRIPYTTFTDLSQKPEIIEVVRKEIEKVNRTLPDYARVKRFVNLHKEFDADEAELTRTRKLRRTFVEDRVQRPGDRPGRGQSGVRGGSGDHLPGREKESSKRNPHK